MRRSLFPLLVLALVMSIPRTAAPWGNAPTHFSIGNDIANNVEYGDTLPESDNPQLFIRANACPDLAWTPEFDRAGLGYVHTPEFAQALYDVARRYWWKSNWRTIAHGFGAHIAADNNVHSTFFENVSESTQSRVEVSVDTIIYYHGSPLNPYDPRPDWDKINVGYDACDPYLFILASRRYRDPTGQAVQAIQWGNMLVAVPELASAIAAEYAYIKWKGSSDFSEAYLKWLVNEGVLPPAPSWDYYYVISLEAAKQWIDDHN